jgi:hypothetical protein
MFAPGEAEHTAVALRRQYTPPHATMRGVTYQLIGRRFMLPRVRA